MFNLENVYFYTVEDNDVIFKMSKESLDNFLEETPLNILTGYKEAELHLTFEDNSLKEATFIGIYDTHKGQPIDVKDHVDNEVIEYALEELGEDSEAFARNLENFHMWDLTDAQLKEVKDFAEDQFNRLDELLKHGEQVIVTYSKKWGIDCCNPWIDASARFPLNDEQAKEEWGEELYNRFIFQAMNHLHSPL